MVWRERRLLITFLSKIALCAPRRRFSPLAGVSIVGDHAIGVLVAGVERLGRALVVRCKGRGLLIALILGNFSLRESVRRLPHSPATHRLPGGSPWVEETSVYAESHTHAYLQVVWFDDDSYLSFLVKIALREAGRRFSPVGGVDAARVAVARILARRALVHH